MPATGPRYPGALSAQEVAALALKAPLASPTFTGVPAAPTAAAATNTTQIATTAFVTAAISAAIPAPTHRYQIPETWYRLAVAISLTDSPLVRAGANVVFANTWVAPRAGSVVAITVRLTSPVTAGGLEADVTINGGNAASALINCTAGANPSGGTVTVAVGDDAYNAGDSIGVSITSNAGLLPDATNNIEAWIEVEEAA